MIKINSKYKPLWEEKTRYYVITGGRGSAKSFTTSLYLTQKTFQQNNKILFTRFTMTSAHSSIIPEFQEKIDLMNVSDHFNINKADITNTSTECEVLFRGIKTSQGNQTAALKSLQGTTVWVLDEAEELVDENTFDKIDLSIRTKGVKNIVIIILNPATKEHWIFKKFFESAGVPPGFNGVKGDVTYIHTDYRDNIDNLDDSFLRQVELLKERRPQKYEHIILGGWLDRSEGVIFSNWELGAFPNNVDYGFGLDFGVVDPDALIKIHVDNKRREIYLKEEIYQSGNHSDALAREMKMKCLLFTNEEEGIQMTKEELVRAGYKNHKIDEVLSFSDFIYIDPISVNVYDEEFYNKLKPKVKMNCVKLEVDCPVIVADSAEPRLIGDLQSRDLNVIAAKKGAGSIKEGIRIMQDYDLIIDPSSVNLIREFNNYAWDDKKSETPIDKWNHGIDASRYYIAAATTRRNLE